MTTSAEPFDEAAERDLPGFGRTVVREDELPRHNTYTRLVHWSVAIFFFAALLSGLAIYSPWTFSWLTPLFGGGALTRALHPWFGLAFQVFFVFQFLNWFAPMTWNSGDTRWIRKIKNYVTNREGREPEDVDFFNGGQKVYFWAIAVCSVLFLITGILLWFDDTVPRWLVAVSYVIHDLAALVMLGGLIIHIYEGTAHQPGTFRSMIDGTVTDEWARTHHPAWYRRVTGRDPDEPDEREKREQLSK